MTILTALRGRITENIDTRRPVKIADILLTDDGLGSNHLFLTGKNKDKFDLRPDGLYLVAGADIDFEQRGGDKLRVTVDITATGLRQADFALPHSISLRVLNEDEPGELVAWTSRPVIGGTLIDPDLYNRRWRGSQHHISMGITKLW